MKRTKFELRHPDIADAPAMWRLACDSAHVHADSLSLYRLWCRDFSATSLVACAGKQLVGFMAGYMSQTNTDTYVTWQRAIDPRYYMFELELAMLNYVADMAALEDIRFLETPTTLDDANTVVALNEFARQHDADVHRHTIPEDIFVPNGCPQYTFYRTGPIFGTPGNGRPLRENS